jgi:AraC-like DNA-binding protein
VVTALVNRAHSPKRAHPKVQQVLAYLRQLPLKKVSIKEIAATVYLSESRIIHLFKEETGIPIRRYLLWLRLIEALKAIFKGVSFTVAAHETGFSDAAHLSRTFKQMFGLTLSELFKNSQFVQAIPCLPVL